MTQTMFQIKTDSITDKGLSEKRPQNEDSFLSLPESGLYAVADGVGGAQAGDVASQMAVEILGEAFINLKEDGDAEDRMRAAIEKANTAIFQMSHEIPQLRTMATTLVAVHINENIATIGHVGDSRLYRLDENGLLFRETQDHSVVEEEVRAGRMTEEQAVSHPSRNVISRALGAEMTVEIDMKTIMFEPNTTFLVCSDGITRHVPDEEIRDLLYMEDDVSEVCRILKTRCYDRGAEDNLTAVVVKVLAAGEGVDEGNLLEFGREAETVATARAASSSGGIFDFEADTLPELATDEDAGAFELEDIEDLDDTDEIVIPTNDVFVEAEDVSDSDGDSEYTGEVSSVKDVKSYRVDENTGSGVFGKILTAFGWILVGTLIGATAFFLYFGSVAQNVETSGAAAVNNTVLGFEQQRRLVDADPAKYLSTYATKENKSAADHYLIGRAYLLQNNYGAAKTSFESAADLIGSEDINNRGVLAHDVAVGKMISTNEAVQKSFEEAKQPKDGNIDPVKETSPDKSAAN